MAELPELLSIVMPVFGTVALGYALGRVGLFDAAAGRALVRFMYYLAIPAMLFLSVAEAELPATMPWRLLGAFYLPSFAVFGITIAYTRWLGGWRAGEAVIGAMGTSYANIVLLGYPLVLSAFDAAANVPLFILLATQSLVMFPLVTFLVERARGEAHGGSVARVLVNPVLISLALGLVINFSQARPPAVLAAMIEGLGAAGPACALVALGISLAQYPVRGATAEVLQMTVAKNLLHPLLVWGCGLALGLSGTWLSVAVVLAAMPSGLNAYVFASHYGYRVPTIAKAIVVSTLLSCVVVTMLLGILPR